MIRLLGILVLVLDVIVIVDIIKGTKDAEKKVLWIIAVFFSPLAGSIIVLCGWKRPILVF